MQKFFLISEAFYKKKMVFNVMNHVINKNLAWEYTFYEKSGRKAFGKKRISNVIKVAVQWRFAPPADATDANINKRIGRWLTEPKDSRVPSKCPLHEEVFVRRIRLFKIILVLSDVISNLFSFCSPFIHH